MSKPIAAVEIAQLAAEVTKLLNSFKPRPAYTDEQKDLQPHLADILEASLPEDLEVIKSVGGKNKPSMKMFGTSFWPDIEIRTRPDKIPLIGIEVKYVRADKPASKAISETLGQALIYRSRYPYVIAYILHDGKYISANIEHDVPVADLLESQGIHLVLKRRS